MNSLRLKLVLVALAMLITAQRATCGWANDASPRIELNDAAGTRATIDVVGLSETELAAFDALSPEERVAVLQVFVESDLKDPPPVGGRVSIAGKRLPFTPRYSLEPGVRYRAVFERARLSNEGSSRTKPLEAVLSIERPSAAKSTVVEHIYPSADRLPENQLKFYVHFSAPMSRGEAYRHIHLLDETTGKEVEGAFLELGEELWDDRFRRFTLLCDPGRVKRGLKPREELGPVLEEGHSYTLAVDAAWRDAKRRPLKSGAAKRFSVGPPDDETVDPDGWQLEPPRAGTSDPLIVRLGEPLDHSMLVRVLSIVDAAGKKVPGTVSTSDDETCWRFTPKRAWGQGSYRLVVDTTLEDLAGNSIGRPFEVDQFERVQRRIQTKTVSVSFDVE
ncbi:MAG: hypothetical protein DWQ37_17430 [Planctomycetota bacterium]|nr:MAG: hypothetical protein DWQ37_17430 [Planctomycetota bacterium]